MNKLIIEKKSQNVIETPTSSNYSTKSFIIKEEMITCFICLEEISSDEALCPLHCGHKFCETCINKYLRTKIIDQKVTAILCPFINCVEKFSEKIIQQIVDQPTFQLYQDIFLRKIMNQNPEHIFCPSPGCINKIKTCKDASYIQCKCNTRICNLCWNPLHEGKTCLEVIDPEFETFVREQNIKFCMMCKTRTEKMEGCKHITCPVCDYEWCWDCGQQYTNTHQKDCAKLWNPVPPKLSTLANLKQIWKTGSKVKKIGLCVLLGILSPALLIGVLLFWPLLIYSYFKGSLTIKKPSKLIVSVLVSILVALLAFPFLIIIAIVLIFVYIVCLPCACE